MTDQANERPAFDPRSIPPEVLGDLPPEVRDVKIHQALSPATLNLDQLRDLVRAHFLVEDLEACLKRAKADLEARERLADEQLTAVGVKTMPVSAEEPAVRVVALAPGRLLVQCDYPGADREDFDHERMNDSLQDTLLAALHSRGAAFEESVPGRNHLRPMNITAARTLSLSKLEGVETPQACEVLRRAGLGEFVQPSYNANTVSAYVREELANLEDEQEHLAAVPPIVEGAAAEAQARVDRIKAEVATLREAFDFKTRTDVRVTRAGNKESRSSRAARNLRRL
jgi:hypothetical protein